MNQGLIEGRIRRKESLQEIKDRLNQPLPAFLEGGESEPASEPLNPVKKYCNELKIIEVLKQKHLTPPKPKGSLMFKLSNLLIILLLIIAGFLFFAGGYILNYMNTAGGVSPAGHGDSVVSTQWRKPQIIGAEQTQDFGPQPSQYKERSKFLGDTKEASDELIEAGGDRSKAAAVREANRLTNQAINSARTTVADTLGSTIANIFNPFAKTVAQGTVGDALGQSLPADQLPPATATAPGAEGGASDAATNATSAAAAIPPAPQTALFALKLRTFLDSAQAYVMARNLKAKGYDAAYVVRGREGDNIVFTVRIGNFSSYKDAISVRKVLNIPSQVVVATPNDDFVKF